MSEGKVPQEVIDLVQEYISKFEPNGLKFADFCKGKERHLGNKNSKERKRAQNYYFRISKRPSPAESAKQLITTGAISKKPILPVCTPSPILATNKVFFPPSTTSRTTSAMSHLTPKMKPSVPLDVDDPIDNEVFMITKLIDQPLGNEVVDILKFKTEISPNPTEFKHHKIVIDDDGTGFVYTRPKHGSAFFEQQTSIMKKLKHNLVNGPVLSPPVTKKQLEDICEAINVKEDVLVSKKENDSIDSPSRLVTTPFKLGERVRTDGLGNENGVVRIIRQAVTETVKSKDPNKPDTIFIVCYIHFFLILDKEKRNRSGANTQVDECADLLDSLGIYIVPASTSSSCANRKHPPRGDPPSLTTANTKTDSAAATTTKPNKAKATPMVATATKKVKANPSVVLKPLVPVASYLSADQEAVAGTSSSASDNSIIVVDDDDIDMKDPTLLGKRYKRDQSHESELRKLTSPLSSLSSLHKMAKSLKEQGQAAVSTMGAALIMASSEEEIEYCHGQREPNEQIGLYEREPSGWDDDETNMQSIELDDDDNSEYLRMEGIN